MCAVCAVSVGSRRHTGFNDGVGRAIGLRLVRGVPPHTAVIDIVRGGDCVVVRRRLGMHLEEEEAAKGETACSPGQEHEEGTRVAGEEERSDGREEEGAEAEGGERKGRGGASSVRPVESRRLDGGGKGHAASEAGQIGEETQEGDGAGCAIVGLMQREVAGGQQDGTSENGRSGTASIDEDTNGHSHGVLAEVAREADEVALGGR